MNRLRIILVICYSLLLVSCAALQHQRAGERYYEEGMYSKAINEYEKAMSIKPELEYDNGFKYKYKKAYAEYHLKRGMILKNQRKFDEAIEQFYLSLKYAPGNIKSSQELSTSKALSSKEHYNKGLALADLGDLNSAIEELNKSVSLDPNNSTAQDALNRAVRVRKEKLEKAESHYKKGITLFQTLNWEGAIKEFNSCIDLDPNHLYARSKTNEAKNRLKIANNYYKKGLEHSRKKYWNQAINQYNNCLKTYPFHTGADKKISEAKNQIENADRKYEIALGLFNQSQWDDAIIVFEEVIDIYPKQSELMLFLKQALEEGANYHCQIGDTLLTKGNLTDASNEYLSALSYINNHNNARHGMAEIYYHYGTNYYQKSKFANALIEYRKAVLMVPAYKDCSNKIDIIDSEIKKRINYKVAVLPFLNNTSERNINIIISDDILDGLVKKIIKNIRILERDYISANINNWDIDINELSSSNTKADINDINEVDTYIAGNILSFNIVSNSFTETNTVQYVSGQREVINPEFEKGVRYVENLREDYHRELLKREQDVRRYKQEKREYEVQLYNYESKLNKLSQQIDNLNYQKEDLNKRINNANNSYPRNQTLINNLYSQRDEINSRIYEYRNKRNTLRNSGEKPYHPILPFDHTISAEMNLEYWQKQLARTPEYLFEDVYSDFTYAINNHTKEANIKVSCRIIDAVTNEILLVKSVQKTDFDRDKSIANSNEAAGVYSDPLELASDLSMKNHIINKTVQEITDEIASSLKEYGQRYLILARNYSKVGDIDNAVEEYVNFIYSSIKQNSIKLQEAYGFIKRNRNYNWEGSNNQLFIINKTTSIKTEFTQSNLQTTTQKQVTDKTEMLSFRLSDIQLIYYELPEHDNINTTGKITFKIKVNSKGSVGYAEIVDKMNDISEPDLIKIAKDGVSLKKFNSKTSGVYEQQGLLAFRF